VVCTLPVLFLDDDDDDDDDDYDDGGGDIITVTILEQINADIGDAIK